MLYKTLHIKSLIIFVGIFTMMSCGTSREVSAEDKSRLDQIINNQFFKIEAQFARPLTTNALSQIANAGLLAPGDNASRINLQGNSAYLKFEGDTVSADLPYFGERQMGGGYSRNTGIEFEGVPKDLEIEKDADKNFYNIKFNISDETENYQIVLKLYPSLDAFININSSQRFPIRYDGTLKAIKEK
ncbi:DUF4251 domain-containing protein [Psychroflexus salinarum]|uniref:DUF4251 domain-containing protein n=1 Tax=Psychroflexus salinarum TaxID=546024 RepID=A0ABW3GSR2_9FLAO